VSQGSLVGGSDRTSAKSFFDELGEGVTKPTLAVWTDAVEQRLDRWRADREHGPEIVESLELELARDEVHLHLLKSGGLHLRFEIRGIRRRLRAIFALSMDFRLTPEQEQIRHSVRELVSAFAGEYWQKLDAELGYPTELIDALTEGGWLAALIPEAYGGTGSESWKRV